MTQSLISSAAPAATAEVRAHDRVVRYRRSGTAGPNLLLLAADSASELWPELPRLLAERFRLVMPALPEPGTETTQSLRCLLDGLGCSGVSVLAAGRYCDAAIALAVARDESVGKVVVVPQRSADDLAAGASDARLADTRPIYVVDRGMPLDEAVEKILLYLL